jgi:hypothetical protein
MSDVIKHMMSVPVLKGRLEKWMFARSEFDIQYQPVKAVKGQALADLIAERINTNIATLYVHAWAMYFDGSACEDGYGIGILLVSPRGVTYSFSIRLPAPCMSHPVLTQNRMLIVCVYRNQVYTHTIQKMDTE